MSAATDVRHSPWCNSHMTGEHYSACAKVTDVETGAGVEVVEDDDGLEILLWPGVDRRVTPAQARVLAAALVEAVAMVEGRPD